MQSVAKKNVCTSKCYIEGFIINALSIANVVEQINDGLAAAQSFYVCTMNLDHVVTLRTNERFRDVYNSAKFITLDSAPLVILKNFFGAKIAKASGSDLIGPICRLASDQQKSVFIIGPDKLSCAKFIFRAEKAFPRIPNFYNVTPSRNFDPDGAEAESIIKSIAGSKASICFIGLGAPKQELFASRASRSVKGVVFLPVGAGVQYYAGTRDRAPAWMQACALEWLWRLIHEPRRLTKRYYLCMLSLLRITWNELRQNKC